MLKLAVDAMGGDHAPATLVTGVAMALREYTDLQAMLVGDEARIRPLLGELSDVKERISVIPASEVIQDDEEPAWAVRRKKGASIVVATRLLREGAADALVTAGSTGAFMAAGLLLLGRLPGIERPALAPILPTIDGRGVLLLDVGANMDATPQQLLQYAIMGDAYAGYVLDRSNPRVALLNVGGEAGKGNELTKAAYELMAGGSFNFVGNLEARDLLYGRADVVVCDGFVGNVVLKFMEGMAAGLFEMLKTELMSSLKSKLGAGLLRPNLMRFKETLDYSEYGGAPLLGVKAPMIKCHGSSDGRAIYNGIRRAISYLERGCGEVIQEAIDRSKVDEL